MVKSRWASWSSKSVNGSVRAVGPDLSILLWKTREILDLLAAPAELAHRLLPALTTQRFSNPHSDPAARHSNAGSKSSKPARGGPEQTSGQQYIPGHDRTGAQPIDDFHLVNAWESAVAESLAVMISWLKRCSKAI